MNRSVKTVITLLLAVSLAWAVASCNKKEEAAKTPGVAAKPASKVLVKVGDKEITSDAVSEVLNRQKLMMTTQGREVPPQMEDALRQKIVDELISIQLVMQDAKAQGVEVSKEDIDKILNQEIQRAGGEEQFNQRLQQVGKTKEQFIESITEWLTIQKLMEKATASIPKPTEEDAKKFFEQNKGMFAEQEQVHAFHILRKVEKDAPPEIIAAAQKKIDEIYALASAKGADFEQLAKDNSECPSAAKGGDLGSFGRGQMVKEFEDAAYGLKVGEISKPIRTQFGFHIIKVTEHKKGKEAKFEDQKTEILQMVERQNRDKSFTDYVKELRNKYKVEYIDKSVEPKPETLPPGEPAAVTPEPEKKSEKPAEPAPKTEPPAPPPPK